MRSRLVWALSCGLLLAPSACAGTLAAERSLRSAEKVGAGGMVTIRGGRLLDLDGERVRIAEFALDVTEVTVAEFRRCLAAGACTLAAGRSTRGCNLQRLDVEQHPINCVSVEEAEAFCRWRGARLPTIDEWLWAAQGRGQARRYVWGDYPRRRALLGATASFEPFVCGGYPIDELPRTATCTVGRYDRSRDGVGDLGGNVSEWVRSASGDGYAVGRSYAYPYVETSRGRGWRRHEEPLDAIRRTLAIERSRRWRTPDAQVGFRCARSLAGGR